MIPARGPQTKFPGTLGLPDNGKSWYSGIWATGSEAGLVGASRDHHLLTGNHGILAETYLTGFYVVTGNLVWGPRAGIIDFYMLFARSRFLEKY